MTEDTHHRRRQSDSIHLPSELFEFPKTDDPILNFLLRQIVQMLDGYTVAAAETNDRLERISKVLDTHTDTLNIQTQQLVSLKSAITFSGIVEASKTWGPVIALLTGIAGAAAWLWAHVKWTA